MFQSETRSTFIQQTLNGSYFLFEQKPLEESHDQAIEQSAESKWCIVEVSQLEYCSLLLLWNNYEIHRLMHL